MNENTCQKCLELGEVNNDIDLDPTVGNRVAKCQCDGGALVPVLLVNAYHLHLCTVLETSTSHVYKYLSYQRYKFRQKIIELVKDFIHWFLFSLTSYH